MVNILFFIIFSLYLSNEEDAEEICEKCLNEGLKFDENSFDILIQLSNLRILRCKDEEALNYMEKIYNNIIDHVENNSDTLPSHDIMLNLAKNYAELENFVKAIKIFDVLIKLNDEDVKKFKLIKYFSWNVGIYWLLITLK
jgi:tetratricopeptide (TPR) repeat protein